MFGPLDVASFVHLLTWKSIFLKPEMVWKRLPRKDKRFGSVVPNHTMNISEARSDFRLGMPY
ncbi:hypothetical protein DTL21_06595 [Bremerella cremea]|uniref:Uncharacterized protein n=1 Tax=Blastopirellula marina TaxID=124 RepID=A0A2S8FZI8_9BACT|nr:hypothetical protein C5Y83_06595 [Blastopirellula marina]RCS49996.1 hypothetical protein DTL21_06595 [Bremerella cremea]